MGGLERGVHYHVDELAQQASSSVPLGTEQALWEGRIPLLRRVNSNKYCEQAFCNCSFAHVNISSSYLLYFYFASITRRVGTCVWAEASPHSPHWRVFEYFGRR